MNMDYKFLSSDLFSVEKPASDRRDTITTDWVYIIQESVKAAKEKEEKLRRINIKTTREKVEFHTKSAFTGEWDVLGITGYGKFQFPNGCEYEGSFFDGMFHGEGTLVYPMGQQLDALFDKGKMIAYKFSNVDKLQFEESWEYCRMPDRRFNVSIREGLQPAGREYMTNQQPERKIFAGCYDTCDGYYQPDIRCVTMIRDRDPEDFAQVDKEGKGANEETGEVDEAVEEAKNDLWIQGKKIVSEERHDWITQNCRKAWDAPVGYRPEFYEDWISGRRNEIQELEEKYKHIEFLDESSESSETKSEDNVVILEDTSYAGTGRKLEQKSSFQKLELNL